MPVTPHLFLPEIKELSHCRNQCRHFVNPAARTSAGYRLLPLDLNYSDDGQVFAMAFAERVSMVSIIR
ncbi:hypothetical protein GFL49_11190 [Rhizobium leguminosarum bv. viciae]|nr:hypothetical protein [Rhizobium leguminosarum bv. viciae]